MDQLNKIAEFTIYGKMASLNEYINVCRRNVYAANTFKHTQQSMVKKSIIGISPIPEDAYPVYLKYTYWEQNSRRDLDNISSIVHKFTQDALVESGIMRNDTAKEICGFSDDFPGIDRDNPRIEVSIYSANSQKKI